MKHNSCVMALALAGVAALTVTPTRATECLQGAVSIAPDDQGTASNTACGNLAGIGGALTNTENSAFGVAAGIEMVGSANTAVGTGALGFVTGSGNVGIGEIAGDNMIGNFNNAIGNNSGKGVTGDQNIAMGFFAGNGIGSVATPVSRTIAIGGDGNFNFVGARATANDAMAIGTDASASGVKSIAIGTGAIAGQANAAAFGQGAQTTRADQQVFGTTTNTYTMTGITSAASKTAQGAPTQIVTSNDSGDLATYTAAQLGLASSSAVSAVQSAVTGLQSDVTGLQSDVTGLQSNVAALQSDINRLGKRDSELADGIAIAVAMAQPMFQPGQTFAMRAGWGNFDGHNAVGVTAAGVITKGDFGPTSSVVLDGGIGASTQDNMVAGRVGLTFGM